jgi:hypothetical protein
MAKYLVQFGIATLCFVWIPLGVLRLQLDEGIGHAVELERSHLVESGMRKHC